MVLGFESADIESLAARLGAALGVELVRSNSPLIGPWWSDVDASDVIARVRAGQPVEDRPERFQLRLNDPDPYRPPEWPRAIGCVLDVGRAVDAADVRRRLAAAGLAHVVLRE